VFLQRLLGIEDTFLTIRFKAKKIALDFTHEQSTVEKKIDEKVDEKNLIGAKKSSNGF
jgi:hypothetical protein